MDVFRLKEQKDNTLVAHYMRSVKITDPNLNGILNDVTVVGDYIYLSQYLPFPDSIAKGRDHGPVASIKRTFMQMLLKTGTIHKCKNTRADTQLEEEAECEKEAVGVIGVGNGLTTDGFKKLWAVDN